MHKVKLSDIFVPKYRFYLFVILILLVLWCMSNPNVIIISSAAIIYMLILIFTYERRKNEIEKVIKYMDSYIIKLNADESILNFPLASVIVSNEGSILWNNDIFENLFKGINKDKYIASIIKELNESFDENSKTIDRDLSIHDKHYKLLGNIVNIRKRGKSEKNLMLYFIERTDFYKLYKAYEDSKNCVGIIIVDNYDEVIQGISETEKAQLIAQIENELRKWYSITGGIFSKLDRNKFLICFEKKYLKNFVDSKFDILDSIKTITFSNKIPVTLSIAIVIDDNTLEKNFQNAYSTLEIALGRGGDQAIIKNESKYEFIGGKSKEVEKRTKVKSRVIAGALQELISESKNVIIMGHRRPDADCLGSALGVYRIAKSLNKEAYILYNKNGIALDGMVKRLNKEKAYDNVLLTTSELENKITSDSLLVVVDTHKNDYVEEPKFLSLTNKVVLIDHHRRSADFISNPTLIFHEVYASSACELVTEIIQYLDKDFKLPMVEAEALYAGILTDTKNFTFKTGVRTFEAAAYLKKLGVDITAVKKLFDNDIETYVEVADVIRTAKKITNDVAIAVCPGTIDAAIQIAAQAADELISLNGIETSFVLVDLGDYINVSGRSNGNLNVQVVLEKLGGGGHQTVAGAQLYDTTMDEAINLVTDAVLKTINENGKKE